MQPAFIRLIDNLRKQLDASSWRGTYEEAPKWAEGISEETKARVALLRSELAKAEAEAALALEQALAELPTPYPGYVLQLSYGNQQVTLDLWDLCYQICFRDYDSLTGTSRLTDGSPGQAVEVDSSLLAADTGELNWNRLDEKAQELVAQVFESLNSIHPDARPEPSTRATNEKHS